ncbi:hypothetical protein [Mycobacteroides abscessus]|uniref:hypothetical protein n=1 Tax=Mycobacteroides abscessus TaxID=36809 RepID=UPI0013FD0A8D|nr:hypothetical protein [Mycobacteroides abscessus]
MDDDIGRPPTPTPPNGDVALFAFSSRMIEGVRCYGGYLTEQQMITDIEAFLADH